MHGIGRSSPFGQSPEITIGGCRPRGDVQVRVTALFERTFYP
ncbi:hypothetical protein C7S13_6072 [Burkholderia cepacia]|nr:hypothetical protein [Burkholderia cepacia]